MQFYFIRHGQSENNALWLRTGSEEGRSDDPGLTDLGRRQTEALARFLVTADLGITHLYTSLMIRAVATGAILAEALGLPLVAWEDLHEVGGIYLEDKATGERVGRAGANRAYFAAHYPGLILPDSVTEAGWWNRPFEEREQRPARARRFWTGLKARHGHTDDRVAVISHGGFYNHLLAVLLDMPTREGYWFVLHNTALSRIDFPGERVELVYLNRTDHLPPDWLT